METSTDPMNDLNTDACKSFTRSLKATAGSRFIAARRLENNDKRLTILIALAASLAIILAVSPYLIGLPHDLSNKVNLFNVSLSIIILISSLLQYSNNGTLNAEQHHRCALEINEIIRDIEARSTGLPQSDFLEYVAKYSLVLQKYSINHDECDYWEFQLNHPEEHTWMSWYSRLQKRVMIFWLKHKLILLLVAMTMILSFAIHAIA
jgi:SMODS and SLOG-associating 2TM effector domain family 5